MRSFAARVATCAVAAVCVAGAVAPAAVADPPPGVVPAATDLVGVGASFTERFMNQTSVDYNAGAAPELPRLYNWDATGSSPIVPKAGAAPIARPAGSGAGIAALASPVSGAALDYARSTRGPLPSDPAGLSFVPFAKDAVTWSAKIGGNAPADLSIDALKRIYECTLTVWYPGVPNVTIKPVLPSTGSDTRALFLKAIGNGTSVVPGSCVTTVPFENRGTDPLLDDPNVVFPYSVGVYLDQVYRGHGTTVEAPGSLTLRGVNGIAPVVFTSVVGINPAFAATPFGRVVWNVVRTADFNNTGARGTAVRAVFSRDGWICAHGSAITARGFSPIPDCGAPVNT
ncbi:substrate-binding domain-containing protein [Kitasatospora sp. NPDC057541]|uniref:substrate-binding domain-containing protein n=1 Tax=Kitasatospora sp. NPDC057541 TaxID=3346161 RepID=UPI0036A5A582